MSVIRRHHPLRGQKFVVLQGGKRQITIRLTDGTSMRIPRHWTDADGEAAAGGKDSESIFSVDSMRRLFELVDAFCRR